MDIMQDSTTSYESLSVEDTLDIDDSEDQEVDMITLIEEVESSAAENKEDSDLLEMRTIIMRIRGFIAKVRRSLMAKAFFLECCRTVRIPPQELLAFCPTRWCSLQETVERVLLLEKAVKLFLNTADDSNEVPKVAKGQKPYASYKLSSRQWELVALIRDVLKVRT